ncbi:hypothetical protein X768_19890 [Mesorhizobium sp. LSJC265A00]|nr:hypothetical protein X768_19890 [Mesorhizobium sp. LSJC265A00]
MAATAEAVEVQVVEPAAQAAMVDRALRERRESVAAAGVAAAAVARALPEPTRELVGHLYPAHG